MNSRSRRLESIFQQIENKHDRTICTVNSSFTCSSGTAPSGMSPGKGSDSSKSHRPARSGSEGGDKICPNHDVSQAGNYGFDLEFRSFYSIPCS